MPETRSGIAFGPYRLEVDGPRLWKGDEPVALQPRPLAVLAYLAARPGVVVGRDELIVKLWAGTYVTKAVLKVAVRAIREALEDDPGSPRYIETVGREGYRFIGSGVADAAKEPASESAGAGPAIVGRDEDFARLRAALAQARGGTRKLLFVTGEAGIGKTTLLDRFLAEAEEEGSARVARGQCLEQYGEGEPYLPLLEALAALTSSPHGQELNETLRRHAPTWVSQFPSLATNEPPRSRQGDAIATIPARMLREMADALEIFTHDRPLVLALEDLQWSDRSTVDLIGCLARRRQPARLLVIGSLRPVDMIVHDHPLRAVQHELQAKGLCEEIALELLSRDDVAAYLAARFGGASASALRPLAKSIYQRTEGNALFLINMVNDLVAAGLLAWRDGRWHVEGSIDTAAERIPEGLHELIGLQMGRLAPPLREVLEAASVAGDEFAVAAVAAALGDDEKRIEDVCEQVAAQEAIIADAGVAEWADGSVTGRYRFRHALYRQVLYEGIGEARRVRLHHAIGVREEAGFGAQAFDHAAELAMHFTRGRAHERALHFHELAAASALDRHAAHEAVAHFTAALAALGRAHKEPQHARELELVVAVATLLMAIQGYAAPETERAFARARALCDKLPPGPKLYPVLRGLVSYYQVRAELGQAHALGEQLLAYASERRDDRALAVQAHYGHGATLFHMGEFTSARAHIEAALGAYDPATHRHHILAYGGYDPGVACLLWLAWMQALQGELEEAAVHNADAVALAERHGELFSLTWAHYGSGVSHQFFGDWPACEAASTAAAELAEMHGFPYLLGMATINRGWSLMNQGKTDAGIPMLRDGVSQVERTGAVLVRPAYLAMLAAVDVLEGDRKSATARVEEAFKEMERSGELFQQVPLLIGKSNLLAGGKPSRAAAHAAETCLRQALEVARAQGIRLLELRAAVALYRHCRGRGRAAEAREPLAAAYAWFANRQATAPEVLVARQLLAEPRD